MRQKAGVDASARASDRVLLLPSIALGVHGRIDAMTGSTARLRRVQLIRDKDAGAPIASSAAPPVSPTPKSDDGAEEASPLERASADYTCSDDAFLVGDRCYDRQYAHLYFQRLRPRPLQNQGLRPWAPCRYCLNVVSFLCYVFGASRPQV